MFQASSTPRWCVPSIVTPNRAHAASMPSSHDSPNAEENRFFTFRWVGPNGILQIVRAAIPHELVAVVVAPAGKQAFIAAKLIPQDLQRVRQRRGLGDHLGRDAGQPCAELAHFRHQGLDHDAPPFASLEQLQIHHAQADLDDLAGLAAGRLVLPARRLDIDHQGPIQLLGHIPLVRRTRRGLTCRPRA